MSATAVERAPAGAVAPTWTAVQRPQRSFERPLLAAAILAVTARGADCGYHYWTVGRFFASTDDAYVGGDVTVTPFNGAMMEAVRDLEARDAAVLGGDPAQAHAAAMKQLWSLAWREAQTMTYAHAFLLIAAAFALATALVPLMRKVAPPERTRRRCPLNPTWTPFRSAAAP